MPIPDPMPGGSSTIDQAFIEAFRSNCIHLSQQKPSRLRSTVIEQVCKAEICNVERVGSMEVVQRTTRHTPTVVLDVPHSRRRFPMEDWYFADLIDHEDTLRMLVSPKSEYAKTGAWAMQRQIDRTIIAAATGDSMDGDGNLVPFDPNMIVGAGGAGLTLESVLAAKEKLDANEVDHEDRYLVINSKALSDLLMTTEVTSQDFNTVRALVDGSLNSWCGFQIKRTELVAEDTAQCLAYHKSAIRLAMGQDIQTKIDVRPDVSYAWQVFMRATHGACRVEEEKIVQILI